MRPISAVASGPSITGILDVHEDHVGVDERALVESLQAVGGLADDLDVRVAWRAAP